MKKRECYVVKSGDTLSDIAATLLGDAKAVTVLWAINRSHLRGGSPSSLFPGEIILLPPGCKEQEQQHTPLPWTLRDEGHDVYIVGPYDGIGKPTVCEFPSQSKVAIGNARLVMDALHYYIKHHY